MIDFSKFKLGEKPNLHIKTVLYVSSNVTPGGAADKARIGSDLRKRMFAAVYGGAWIAMFNAAELIEDKDSPAFYTMKGALRDMARTVWPDEDNLLTVRDELISISNG